MPLAENKFRKFINHSVQRTGPYLGDEGGIIAPSTPWLRLWFNDLSVLQTVTHTQSHYVEQTVKLVKTDAV